MKLFLITSGHERYYVEAKDMPAAVELWSRYVDCVDEIRWPDSIEMLCPEPVIR